MQVIVTSISVNAQLVWKQHIYIVLEREEYHQLIPPLYMPQTEGGKDKGRKGRGGGANINMTNKDSSFFSQGGYEESDGQGMMTQQ